jgi:hypothetical protein
MSRVWHIFVMRDDDLEVLTFVDPVLMRSTIKDFKSHDREYAVTECSLRDKCPHASGLAEEQTHASPQDRTHSRSDLGAGLSDHRPA